MPVFTTAAIAVAAVGTAVGTAATIAAVATAVVAVSAAIGVVGLALSVVGAITGDETLGKVGKYMGYAGLAGGLAGAAIGGIGALSAGTGSFLEGATAPFSEVANMTEQVWNDYGNLNMFTGKTSIADQASLLNAGRVAAAAPAVGSTVQAASSALPEAQAVGSGTLTPGQIAGTDPVLAQGTSIAEAPTVGAPSAVQAPVNPAAAAAPAPAANPTVLNTDVTTGSGILQTGANLQVTNPLGAPGATSLGEITKQPGGFAAWFNAQDSFTKYAVLQGGTTAIQGVGGALGGLFTAATEEEKLAFERERQAFIQGQQGLMNTRTSTAPLLTFDQTRAVKPAGMLNQA